MHRQGHTAKSQVAQGQMKENQVNGLEQCVTMKQKSEEG